MVSVRPIHLVGLLFVAPAFLAAAAATTGDEAKGSGDDAGGGGGPLLVIGAGIGRTGTDSLKLALNALGVGPTYHMHEVLGMHLDDTASRKVPLLEFLGLSDGHNERWIEVEHNLTHDLPVRWDFLTDFYNSAVDSPEAAFWPQLLEANPTAKVVLTVRDASEWHRSINAAWCKLVGGGSAVDRLVRAINGLRPFHRRHNAMHAACERAMGRLLDRPDFTYARICDDREYALSFFDDWNAKAREVVPNEEQLLVFETGKDGYRELANFLGVPEPKGDGNDEVPYPNVNSSAEFAHVHVIMRTFAFLTVFLPCLVVWLVCRKLGRSTGTVAKPKTS